MRSRLKQTLFAGAHGTPNRRTMPVLGRYREKAGAKETSTRMTMMILTMTKAAQPSSSARVPESSSGSGCGAESAWARFGFVGRSSRA